MNLDHPILKRLTRSTDLVAAAAVVLVVVMLVIPLPPFLLDLAITLNISIALSIVVATLYLPRALDFSAFPSVLLLTTMLRLAINVSVTRLILLHGDAGHVVSAFGNFVVGGNVVVGLVIFFILVVIQFAVVTAGAGRVAEVAARFTLDAMPGKQMAIDADLNTGQISDAEARRRREEIAREADFYGAMDGASKFVKGDAMAGVLITVINLIGGIVVGVLQQGLSFGEAASTFSLLTVGDGLCAQIPALLISIATGIIVTRSASDGDLGSDVARQILDQRKAPLVAGTVICAFALVPGLPKVPFLLIGAAFFTVGWVLRNQPNTAQKREQERLAGEAAPPALEAPRDQALEALAFDTLELALGFGLVPLVEEGDGSRPPGALAARVKLVRRQIAHELGIVIPAVRIHDDATLDAHEYVVRVRGADVARSSVLAGHMLAMDSGEAFGQLTGVPTVEPAFGLPATWIPAPSRAEAEALGYTVVDHESVLVTHLTETIRANAADLLTRQETRDLLTQLELTNKAVVDEVVPDQLTLGELQRVLQGLLAEGVSIRDLGAIVESVGDKARLTRDPAMLAEYARQALGRSIVGPFLDADHTLRTIAIDPMLEQEVADALAPTAEGEVLALEPSRAAALVGACATQVETALGQGLRPVLLCSARVRRHVRRLCEQALPQLVVCAYVEIPPGVRVESIGVVATDPLPVPVV